MGVGGDVTERREAIPKEYEDFRGFVYKVKGFTIGDNTQLRKYFTSGSGTLYNWYSGEIYVLDQNLIPNTERNDFEAGPSKEMLETKVSDILSLLNRKADKFRIEGNTYRELYNKKSEVEKLFVEISEKKHKPSDAYAKIANLSTEVTGYLPKLSADKKPEAIGLIEQIEQRKSEIKARIDDQAEESPASKAGATEKPKQKAKSKTDKKKSVPEGDSELGRIIREQDWKIPPKFLPVVQIIDDALVAVLLPNSDNYRAVLSEIESRLSVESGSQNK